MAGGNILNLEEIIGKSEGFISPIIENWGKLCPECQHLTNTYSLNMK